MKKLLSLLLVCMFCLTLLAGCSKEEQNPAGTVSDFESQTHIQPGISGDDPASGDTSKAPLSGEFVVSEKKYDYKDGNLELLYVENQTDRHYDITIHGTYLDENGETIKEETQTFAGFASGWSNNFIFYPRMAFDSFTYTVEMEESTGLVELYGAQVKTVDKAGNPLVSYIDFVYGKNLIWQRAVEPINEEHPDKPKEMRALCIDSTMKNSHQSMEILCECFILILDSDGEVFITSHDYFDLQGLTDGTNGFLRKPDAAEVDYVNLNPIWWQDVGGDETIPENVQGVLTAIFAVTRVYDWNDWRSKS